MPSSSRPYQSKVLRFVLRQWQQGWERQDRTFRQLRSTATWGAQVATLPVYAIMRAVKRASLTLGSGPTPSPQTDSTIDQVKESVTDLNHSLTAILSYTQQQLSSRQTAQLAITEDSNVEQPKNKGLSSFVHWIQQQLPFRRQRVNRSRQITTVQQTSGSVTTTGKQFTNLGVVNGHGSIHRPTSSGLLQQGTTLASSLKTKRLVLVNRKNEVFDIFTSEQQTDLKHYIDRVMYAYRQTRTIVPRQTKRLSVKTFLAIGATFVAALPTEFRKAWTQIASGSAEPSLPTVNSDASQPRFRVFYPQAASPGTIQAKARRLQPPSTSTKAKRHLSSNSPHAFEANINDVSYLEHPLERILRWIDRVLTWCEQRWQKWLNHRSHIG